MYFSLDYLTADWADIKRIIPSVAAALSSVATLSLKAALFSVASTVVGARFLLFMWASLT